MKKRSKRADKNGVEITDLMACMDYLHGDVVNGEYQAACEYEYARESNILRKTAALWSNPAKLGETEIDCEVEREFECGYWFTNSPWSDIWQCPSFPAKGWNQLGDEERREILHMGGFPLPADEIRPLRMNEVWRLNAMGVFDEFKAMAEKVMAEKRTLNANPNPIVYPVIEGWPNRKQELSQWVHALFHIDFGKTKKRLRQEFEKWLDLQRTRRGSIRTNATLPARQADSKTV